MTEQYLSLIFDTLLSFSELFEIDTQQIQNARCNLAQSESPIKTPFPKARFFDFLSKEMERQIQIVIDPYKDLGKRFNAMESQTDAILYKMKLFDQKQCNIQEQLNEKPTRKDVYEIKEHTKRIDTQLQTFISEQDSKDRELIDRVDEKINNIVTKDETNDLIYNAQQEIISYCQKQFAPKEFTFTKLNNLECQFNFINEQSLDLKKYTITNVTNLVQKQNQILSDLTTTVKQHEFQEFLQQSENFVKKQELMLFKKHITPQIEALQEENLNFQKIQNDFAKVIKKTDYEMLQKATKMDWEILKIEQQGLLNSQKNISQEFGLFKDKISSFYQFIQDTKQEQITHILDQVNNSLTNVIESNVREIMQSFDLENVQIQLQKFENLLKSKANKIDVLEIFQLKCNKSELQNTELIVSQSTHNLKQITRMFSELLELFTGTADLESANFKKNQVQKILNDVNQLNNALIKVSCTSPANFRSESEDPFLSTRRTVKGSPKNTIKVFLRPLLSTSYQVNYKKGKQLNNSNS